jgi:hypothetical protein
MTLAERVRLDHHRRRQEVHLIADLASHLKKAPVGCDVDAALIIHIRRVRTNDPPDDLAEAE